MEDCGLGSVSVGICPRCGNKTHHYTEQKPGRSMWEHEKCTSCHWEKQSPRVDDVVRTEKYRFTTTDSEMEKLRYAAYPLVKLLQEEYDSRATILVENDCVTVRYDALGISYSTISDK